jgi:hypothetical protein
VRLNTRFSIDEQLVETQAVFYLSGARRAIMGKVEMDAAEETRYCGVLFSDPG